MLRHDYEHIAPHVLWKLVRDDLPLLEEVCRGELWPNREIGSSEFDGGPILTGFPRSIQDRPRQKTWPTKVRRSRLKRGLLLAALRIRTRDLQLRRL